MSLVVIVVTRKAILTKSEEGPFAFFEYRVFDAFGFVAGRTFLFGMFTFQGKSGEVVVEFLFVQTNHVEVASVVIAMAHGAVFHAHFLRRVKAFVSINFGFDLFVAGQTFLAGYFFAYRVTLRTVADTFEMRMGFGQVVGGHLRCRSSYI
jgi:hypothetical protein